MGVFILVSKLMCYFHLVVVFINVHSNVMLEWIRCHEVTTWLDDSTFYSSNISQYVWVNHKVQEKDTQLIIGFHNLYAGHWRWNQLSFRFPTKSNWKLFLLRRRRLCAISRGSGCWWGRVARPFLRSHVRSWDLKILCLLRFCYGFCLPAPWNPLAEREAGR